MIYRILLTELIDSVTKKKSNLSSIYLAIDCISATVDYKAGLLLTLDKLKMLKQYGFVYLWISDTPIESNLKEKDPGFKFKGILSSIFQKFLKRINEKNSNRFSSTIRYLNSNDLLRYPLEILQYDGAFYLLRDIFSGVDPIDRLKENIFVLYENLEEDEPYLPLEHISLGNAHLYKENFTQYEAQDLLEGEFSNYILCFTIHRAFLFTKLLKKIQKIRKDFPKNLRYKKSMPSLRFLYTEEEVKEALFSFLFSKIGLYHISIQKILLRASLSYFDLIDDKESNGIHFLSLQEKKILDKHGNVSYNLFYHYSRNFLTDIGKNIFRFGNRSLKEDIYTYPYRKEETKIRYVDNKEVIYKQYNEEIKELSRLAYIVDFFVKYFLGSPLNLPAKRFQLIEYMIENSIYPHFENKSGFDDKDLTSLYDLNTRKNLSGLFDAYLLDLFLESIQLYSRNEKVPIYYRNVEKKFSDAIVIDFNKKMPHKPVVKIINAKNSSYENKILDLSHQDNSNFSIGEYVPTINLEILDSYNSIYEKKVKKNISKKEMHLNEIVDSSLKDEIVLTKEDLYDIEIKKAQKTVPFLEDYQDFLKRKQISSSSFSKLNLELEKKKTQDRIFENLKEEKENEDKENQEPKNKKLESMEKQDIKQEVDPTLVKKMYFVYIQHFDRILPYCLGHIASKDEENIQIFPDYILKCINEDYENYFYQCFKLDLKHQKPISIYRPKASFLRDKDKNKSYYLLHSEYKEDFNALNRKIFTFPKRHKISSVYYYIYGDKQDAPEYISTLEMKTQEEYLTHKITRSLKDDKIKFERIERKSIKDFKNLKRGRKLKIEELFNIFNLEDKLY